MSVDQDAERLLLERKDRADLVTMATALGEKPPARAKKADIVELILRVTNVASNGSPTVEATASPAPSGRNRRTRADNGNGNGTTASAPGPVGVPDPVDVADATTDGSASERVDSTAERSEHPAVEQSSDADARDLDVEAQLPTAAALSTDIDPAPQSTPDVRPAVAAPSNESSVHLQQANGEATPQATPPRDGQDELDSSPTQPDGSRADQAADRRGQSGPDRAAQGNGRTGQGRPGAGQGNQNRGTQGSQGQGGPNQGTQGCQGQGGPNQGANSQGGQNQGG
ncbi:MAG: hypothetical protein M3Z46_12955, partial [Actinomycetota bacterium]|nr:hypothetical protein [Actinomycetota bacterium]